MQIRPATIDDIPAMAAMGRDFDVSARQDDLFEYVEADCIASLEWLLSLDIFLCFVAEAGGIVGMVGGMVSPVYFNRAHKSGEELFWWVADGAPAMTGIRLLNAIEDAAKAQGCSTWQMKCIDRLEGQRMAKLYERRGYRPFEHTFIKRFN
jgi:GNAT superfamily N-acetyltransferase